MSTINFHELQQKLHGRDPHSFLVLATDASKEEEDPFFIFQETIEKTFESNVKFLASSETLNMEELVYWKEHDFLVVCQTIDGDFIGGNTDETFVIPQSLYKNDIEIYPFFLSDFFIAYEAGHIESKILPPVVGEKED